jgi:histone-lysine N-methyltransferase SETMAR
MTGQKLLELAWEVLVHPPYSPDIAPSDFPLFWSLQNSFNGKIFNSLEDCQRHLEQFFVQKDKKFWEDEVIKLPEKWQKIVELNIAVLMY